MAERSTSAADVSSRWDRRSLAMLLVFVAITRLGARAESYGRAREAHRSAGRAPGASLPSRLRHMTGAALGAMGEATFLAAGWLFVSPLLARGWLGTFFRRNPR